MINVNLLPRNLRKVREPGYWRLLAVAVPLLVFGVVFAMQYLALQTVANLDREIEIRQETLALLQPFVDEQARLQARQRQLNELIAVADAVRKNRIEWTSQIVSLLETLPPRGEGERPDIDFRSLNMRAVVPPSSNPDRYEGAPIVAEMSIGGSVDDLKVMAQFLRNLEESPSFGVVFQNASRQAVLGDDGSDLDADFSYSITVGAIDRGGVAP